MSKKEVKKEITKDRRVKNEIVRLNKIFKDAGKEKLKVASSIVENAAFMFVVLQDLQEDIKTGGAIEKYMNGKYQWGLKANPAVQAYNSTLKNYSMLMKQLSAFLLGEGADYLDDGFDDFRMR